MSRSSAIAVAHPSCRFSGQRLELLPRIRRWDRAPKRPRCPAQGLLDILLSPLPDSSAAFLVGLPSCGPTSLCRDAVALGCTTLNNFTGPTRRRSCEKHLTSMIPPSCLKLDKSQVSLSDDYRGVYGPGTIEFVTWLASNGDSSGTYCNMSSRGCPVGSPPWTAMPMCGESMRIGYDRATSAEYARTAVTCQSNTRGDSGQQASPQPVERSASHSHSAAEKTISAQKEKMARRKLSLLSFAKEIGNASRGWRTVDCSGGSSWRFGEL